MKTWIFQGNPKEFDIDSYVSKNKEVSWNVRQEWYSEKIKLGDEVYIWRSNGKEPGGIVAYGTISKEVYIDDNKKNVMIRIVSYRLNEESGMLLREHLKNDIVTSNLRIIRQPSGTNFETTEEESEYLKKLWTGQIKYNFKSSDSNIDPKYFYQFKQIADDWFKNQKNLLEGSYNFFKTFKTINFLDNLSWKDMQDMGNYINAFNSLELAKRRALGKPNNSIDHYRESFKYLIYGNDSLKERINNFRYNKKYKLFGFGESAISEILGNLFPKDLCFFNSRDKISLSKILGIDIKSVRGETFADKYIKFNEVIKDKNIDKIYLDIVGKQTTLPLNYEIDQFFSYLYEEYKDKILNRYWVVSLDEKDKLEEEFFKANEVSIGYDCLDNLEEYTDEIDIENTFKQLNYENNDKEITESIFPFVNEVQVDDIVILIKCMETILGIGRITSDYIYEEQRESIKHIRKVEWIKKGEWNLNINKELSNKKLVDISDLNSITKIIDEIINGNKNLDKEDFVEDIKENEDRNNIYQKDDILKDIFLEESKVDDIIFNLDYKKNIILQGPPGVGKTFLAKRICYLHQQKKSEENIETVQFHQSYSYEDFIRGYRPNKKGGFYLKDGIFYKFVQKAIKDKENNYYFIIDEINRGNLSKIFGELMMLIETDKRGEEHQVALTYQENYEKFFIPENIYIIGTMNTADRSLAMVDYALRRRFAFIDIEPAFENESLKQYFNKYLGESMTEKIISKITNLNQSIEKENLDLGKGYKIGHSYFTPNKEIDDVDIWYKRIIKMEIEPLIREYWFDKSESEIKMKVDDLLE